MKYSPESPRWKVASRPTRDMLLDYLFNSMEHTSGSDEAVQEIVSFGFDPDFSKDVVKTWEKERPDKGSVDTQQERAESLVDQVMQKHRVRYR
jgi:hypothetical protein